MLYSSGDYVACEFQPSGMLLRGVPLGVFVFYQKYEIDMGNRYCTTVQDTQEFDTLVIGIHG